MQSCLNNKIGKITKILFLTEFYKCLRVCLTQDSLYTVLIFFSGHRKCSSSQKSSTSLWLSSYGSACVRSTMFLPCLWVQNSRQCPPKVLISLNSKASFFKSDMPLPLPTKQKTDLKSSSNVSFRSLIRKIFPIELRWLARPKMLSPQG